MHFGGVLRGIVKLTLGLVFLFSMSSIAWAEGQIGNGGDVVICQDVPSATVLDFYNARRMLNLHPSYGRVNEIQYNKEAYNFAELEEALPIVEFWLKGLDKVRPTQAQKLRGFLKAFPNEWRLIPNQPLEDINDYGDIRIGKDCEIAQVAIQKTPKTSLQGRYIVDGTYWQLLTDPLERAGLILHEIVYREALERGHLTSEFAREVVALIADQINLAKMIPEDYVAKLVEMQFTGYFILGSLFPNEHFALYPEDYFGTSKEAAKLCKERHGPYAGLIKERRLRNLREERILFADQPLGKYVARSKVLWWSHEGSIYPKGSAAPAAAFCEF